MAKLTREQCIERFLAHLDRVARYCINESRARTVGEKIHLAIFSTLSAIDGSSVEVPSFLLCPAAHSDDKRYHEEQGEDYWPEEAEHCDIAGELHSAWAQRADKHGG